MITPYILLIFFFLSQIPLVPSTLVYVIEVYRHGAREPLRDYWNAKDFKSKGELTPVGMRQHYVLGKALRTEYIDNLAFLSANYSENELYVYSTNVNRTIMSALSQLYGLYPLGSGPKVPDNMNTSLLLPPFAGLTIDPISDSSISALPLSYQPIPIHTDRLDQEYLLRSWDPNVCPINRKWYQAQYSTQLFKDINKEFNETMMNVADMVGLSRETMDLWKMHDIYDIFQNDIYAGKALPNDFEVYHKNMSFLYDFLTYFVDFGSIEQKRMLSTPFFDKVLKLLDGKVKGEDNRKWIMYSAHDITLIMILSGLNYTSYECLLRGWREGYRYEKLCFPFPTYASNFLIELHISNNNTYNVKIRYNGEYIMEYTYEYFIQKLKGSVIENFQEVCLDQAWYNSLVNNTDISNNNGVGGWGWLFIGLVIGVGVSAVIAGILYKKYMKHGEERIQLEMEVLPR